MVRSPVKSTSSRSPCRVEFECRGAEQLLLSNQKPTLGGVNRNFLPKENTLDRV